MTALVVHYAALASVAAGLERDAAEVAAVVPRLAVAVARAGLHELIAYGIWAGVPVAADLSALCLPGAPGSLPDLAAALVTLAGAVRAASRAYGAADAAAWSRDQLPTAEAVLMLAAWNRLSALNSVVSRPPLVLIPPACLPLPRERELLAELEDRVLAVADHLVEGRPSLRAVDGSTMPDLPAHPARDLSTLLATVDAISDPRHPSTVAVLEVGTDPPRFVVCLPGLQDATGSDGAAADLPGALATLTGHSAYEDGMREALAALPPGSHVLLVGHSQGGMVAEAVARARRVGGTTIDGLVTAGAPRLAQPVDPQVPYLALENVDDPVPLLGRLASAGIADGQDPPSSHRVLVRFRTPGFIAASKHGLGSGGYITEAGGSDPRVQAFAERLAPFLRADAVPATFVQVTDDGGAGGARGLPR